MFTSSKRRLGVAAALAATAVVVSLSGCSAASNNGASGQTLTVLQFESKGTSGYAAFQNAVDLFKTQHPKVTVKLQTTSFDSIRKNAKLVLNGNDVPDVVEVNKGNADAGQLAAQGLLTDVSSEVQKRGWDQTVSGSMQNLARYDSQGNAGSGKWFGVPFGGQEYLLYYNKDAFAKAGISVPTSEAELTSAFDKFLAKGQVPVSSNAGEFGLAQLWYQLVCNSASREQIDNYMFLKGSTDFSSAPWTTGINQLQTWIKKGYLGTKLGSLTQANQEQAFIAGKFPMMFDGSWEFSQVKSSVKFDWGTLLYPGAAYNEGLTGQLLSVPSTAKNKDLAYDFINDMLSAKVQNSLGNAGDIPLRADLSAITDPQAKALNEQFQSLKSGDKLAYFPDYPVAGFLEFQESELQGIANGSKTPAQFNADIQKFYDNGKAQLKNG